MDWKSIVGAVAPVLGSALGGPLGGMALSAVSDALLGKPNGSEGEITTALKAGGPEALLKLKQADQAFATRMKELDIDVERLHHQDRASAREREHKTGDRATPRGLALIIIGGFLAMVWFVISGKATGITDPLSAGLIGTLIGYVSAKADQVVSYYFGSSAGSAEKNALMAQQKK